MYVVESGSGSLKVGRRPSPFFLFQEKETTM
jgi:hypothetical protein